MNKLLLATCAALIMAAATPANAATLIIEEGILTGATGVNVAGSLYDVSFQDGTCADVFGDCSSTTNFAFTGFSSATVAANSLFDQVFVGDFDNFPFKTRGCISEGSCAALIPFAIGPNNFVSNVGAINTTSNDFISDIGFSEGTNTSNIRDYTWARFTLKGSDPVAAVPEPSTWLMMLLGFAGVGFSMRRKKATTGPVQIA